MMHQFWNTVDVTILPPYIPSEAERQDASLYAANIRKLYADRLQVPLVDEVMHTLHHVLLPQHRQCVFLCSMPSPLLWSEPVRLWTGAEMPLYWPLDADIGSKDSAFA